MHKKGAGFWDILAWIVLIAILIWILLKAFGIINTSEIIQYAPLFGVVYLAGWAMHKLDIAVDDIKEFKRFGKNTVNEINNIKSNCMKNHPKQQRF